MEFIHITQLRLSYTAWNLCLEIAECRVNGTHFVFNWRWQRLILEKMLTLDPAKKSTQAYCAAIDDVMADADRGQLIFENCAVAIREAIGEMQDQDAALDRRTAKMRDMKDRLRAVIQRI